MLFQHESRLSNERSKYRRLCSCGHSVIITPTCKTEWIICGWCHKKIYKDLEKQKEQDKLVERENFRLKMWRML